MEQGLTREEFLARFKAEMLKTAGPNFDDGEPIAGYADQTGPTYWEDLSVRGDGPEACAHYDMQYWGD